MKNTQSTVDVAAAGFGYRNGLRQFSRQVNLLLPRPPEFFLEEAKQYLSETLEIPTLEKLGVKKASGVEFAPDFEAFIGFTSVVALHALQSGSIPAYETVMALSAKPASEGGRETNVLLLAPTVSRLSSGHLQEAFTLAALISAEFTLPPNKRTNITDLTDNRLEEFVNLTRSRTKGGFAMRFILKEAFDRGIPTTHLGNGHYQFGYGRNAKVFCRSATHSDSMIGARLTFDKLTCIEHMKAAGIPVPKSTRVQNAKAAQSVARKTGFPVVIKPADRDRGEGVTVDIQTDQEVIKAFERAEKLSNSILLENRIPGICHRLLIFKDQLVFAYARHPLSAVGNGVSTISQLIEENQQEEALKAKHLRKKTCGLDDLAISQLNQQNCTPETVLEAGQIVYLRPYEGEVWGGYDEYLTEKVHPDNAELARRVTRLFHLEVAGIDIISEDISRPWYETGAAINEVNFDPQVGENTARALLELSFPDEISETRIECFIGDGSAMDAAIARRAELARQLDGVFLTSHKTSFDGEGNTIHFSNAGGVFRRSMILLQDSRLSCLIVAIQTDELSSTGLPFEKISAIHQINRNIYQHRDATKPVNSKEIDNIINLLEMYYSDEPAPSQPALTERR